MARKGRTMNDTERELWVINDEGLYRWWKGSRQSKRQFLRENRTEIDAVIERMVSGEKRQHFLAYP